MAIAFDTASTKTTASGTTMSWTHTCTGADLMLIVGVNASQSVSSVTYNSVAMTQAENQGNTYLFYLTRPATGGNTVLVTIGSTGNIRGGAHSYTGTKNVSASDAFHGAVKASGTSTTATVDVTSATGELVVDSAASGQSLTAGAGQTERYTVTQGSTLNKGSSEAGSGTVTMSWTLNSAAWEIVAAAFLDFTAIPLPAATLRSTRHARFAPAL